MTINTIPVITDPLGVHWKQPARDKIEIDDTHAMMNEISFNQLSEYSSSIPTGVYIGKMWKSFGGNEWILRWFGPCDDPGFVTNHQRIIMVVNEWLD